MRFVFPALISIAILLIVTIPSSMHAETPPDITIYIDGNGIAIVTITTGAIEGISSIPLPIKPLEPAIEVRCNNYEIPWLLTDTLQLHLYTENMCSAVVNYIANASIQGDVLAIDITGDIPVKLILDPNIVLLTVPQNITSVAYENGLLTIVFTGPTTIVYTMLTETPPTAQPTKTPTESPTPTQSPAPATPPSSLSTTTSQISKSTPTPAVTTSQQTIEEIHPEILQPATIVVIGIAIVTATIALIILLKQRK